MARGARARLLHKPLGDHGCGGRGDRGRIDHCADFLRCLHLLQPTQLTKQSRPNNYSSILFMSCAAMCMLVMERFCVLQ